MEGEEAERAYNETEDRCWSSVRERGKRDRKPSPPHTRRGRMETVVVEAKARRHTKQPQRSDVGDGRRVCLFGARLCYLLSLGDGDVIFGLDHQPPEDEDCH